MAIRKKKKQETRRVTIIGTGLIGSSLGLALKAAKLENVEVVGHDWERDTATRAHRRGAIDKVEHNLRRAVTEARMVIIATPVLAVREVMSQIATDLADGAVVTDTASTKVQVMRWAEELLPAHATFVGGHPMAGKEMSGPDHAEATLLSGSAYAICPAVSAGEEAVQSVLSLAQVAEAEPLFLDPEEHDQLAAAVSHLPLLLSTALFTLLRSSPSWDDMASMASTGFKDLTRLASGNPRVNHDILVTNREACIHWLERMVAELGRFRDRLQDAGDEALLETIGGAQMDRDVFLTRPVKRHPRATALPDVRKQLIDALVGGYIADRARQVQQLPKRAAGARRDAPEESEEVPTTTIAERIAEDVRRDLEKRSDNKKE